MQQKTSTKPEGWTPSSLYTSLSKHNIDGTSPLTKKELDTLRSISGLQEKEAQAIKELIIQHKVLTTDHETEGEQTIPHGGVQLPFGTQFDGLTLPLPLARIIIK